jgi:chromatin remodeling complex protein RSC6
MAETETKGKRKPSAAFMKPVQPDEKLAAIIGNEPVPRTEVTRKLWDYIRSHNLQDPSNKTKINADDKLKQVFDGRDQVTMFEMTKLVFNHVNK